MHQDSKYNKTVTTNQTPDNAEWRKNIFVPPLKQEEYDASGKCFDTHFRELYNSSNLINNAFETAFQLLNKQQLKLRKFEKHCRSCIISSSQLEDMASMLYDLSQRHQEDAEDEKASSFIELSSDRRNQYFEAVFNIPVAFKRTGYELFRPAEDAFLNDAIAETLARTIHSKFRKHMMDQKSGDIYQNMYLVSGNAEIYEKEFDELNEDIKAANIDSAYHIPSKLLTIGYRIEELEDGTIPELLKLNDYEVESMAIIEHDRWCWDRRLNGWTYNEVRNNELKHHNCLIPYDELPPHEQEKDRIMVRYIPALLVDLGYRAVRVSPDLAEQIPYINQQTGSIFEAETEIWNLQTLINQQNDEIQSKFDETFTAISNIDELKKEISSFHKYLTRQYLHSTLNRLELTDRLLKQIKGAFKNGRHIQKTFMPQTIEFKEYFPESFILFKPKDVVSGDFFFIAKIDTKIIFSAADCTGHGISGSILSGICYNYLHEAVNIHKMDHPLNILEYVLPRVRVLLQHSSELVHGSGEMELALCAIDQNTNVLQVSSYARPVYAFLKGEFTQLGKGAKTVDTQIQNEFHTQEVQLTKGDTVYSFSDGYADQIGGPKNRKYMIKKFKQLLTEIQEYGMQEQCQILNTEIEDWRNASHEDQTDDISILAVKI